MTDPRTALETTTHAGIVTVRCGGEVDLGTAPHLRAALQASIRGHARGVVADLSAATFCDSMVFTVLVEAHGDAQARDIPFAIAADGAAVIRPLELLGLDRLLPLHAAAAAARAAVTGTPDARRP
jgi:anti-anti-sigma factor